MWVLLVVLVLLIVAGEFVVKPFVTKRIVDDAERRIHEHDHYWKYK